MIHSKDLLKEYQNDNKNPLTKKDSVDYNNYLDNDNACMPQNSKLMPVVTFQPEKNKYIYLNNFNI